MKKYQRKGFTLLELIIVIALFSIIMVSVVKLLDPVSKFHVRSANFESTNACVDNMRRVIEGNLKYADRVQLYSGFKPYEYTSSGGVKTSTYAPTDGLVDQVEAFYSHFFANRKFLDCIGSIYVLVFDNEQIVEDDALRNYQLLSELQQNDLNAGKMVRYEFKFDNYGAGLNSSPTVRTWYVNKDLYSNFEYRYTLGNFGDPAGAGPAGPGPAVFDPYDCTISITMNEVQKTKQGLVRASETKTDTASFSMKNVLDAAQKYAKPLNDYIMKEEPTAANILDRFYIDDSTPLPRYVGHDSSSDFDGFYFIYTMPETTYDLMDFEDSASYSTYITDARAYLEEVKKFEAANGIT